MEGVDQDRTGMGNIEGTARTACRAGRESKQVQKGGKLGAVEQNQGSKVPEGLALPSARNWDGLISPSLTPRTGTHSVCHMPESLGAYPL